MIAKISKKAYKNMLCSTKGGHVVNNMTYREFRFLLFFLPIFALKLMNITTDNRVLIVVSSGCFLLDIVGFFNEKMSRHQVVFLSLGVIFTALLVITCGKQGAFFSAIIILSLYKINPKKRIYKWCFGVGLIFVGISAYIERNGSYGIRYINGVWTSIYKRSNILYIAFFAVVCLYLYMQKKNKIKKTQTLCIWVLGYLMYQYTGSRTGFFVLNILILMIIALSNKKIQQNYIVKILCVNSPLIGFLISFFGAYYYRKFPVLYTINSMLQGRLELGQRYLNQYNLRLFGQPIYENFSADNFWCLDSAYLDMLICYGIIFCLVWILLSRKVIQWLYEESRFLEVATIVGYSVYGISETFLPNGFLNMSIFLYAEYIFSCILIRKRGTYNGKNKNNCNVSSAVS
jgi:hypothetical protein